MKLHIQATILAIATSLAATETTPAKRPNILWITCEDTSAHLGCYGDPLAITPNLDKLADEGVRFTAAFAYTGVCAPSRSCLITGVYPLRLGSHHMRSTTTLPESVKCFSEHLRNAGYYCSNNVKEDYNFRTPKSAWDESSGKAHWRNRKDGQPFFAVFNFTVCHQSQIFCSEEKYRQNTRRLKSEDRRDPARVTIPPIHPDTPEFRKEWARHFDNVTAMDIQAGDVLAELEKDGLADDTIVFFFSDHGTGMPSVKMFAWESSLHVPLIVRFPPRWQHLAPGKPGSTEDRMVGFIDFAPTVLSLAGVPISESMQGTAFLGEKAGPPRKFVFGGKDRQGECTDTIRYVRDARFHYIRNFQRHLPYGQYLSYVWQHPSTQRWEELHIAGKLKGPAARFFAPTKPVEELYDVATDPWQINNLAADPAHAADLQQLRAELLHHMKAAGDLGLLPEGEMHARVAGRTPYALGIDPEKNPIGKLWKAAGLANAGEPANIASLTELLDHSDAALRWWGAVGLLTLREQAAPAAPALRDALLDPSADVRLTAAEALLVLGEDKAALETIRRALPDENVFTRLHALQIISRLGPKAVPLLHNLPSAKRPEHVHRDAADYIGRMVGYLPDRIRRNAGDL